MTPEHVSELQNILRFLRANAFEKSEAALVEEVEVLMRAAQLEKDDAERRLASASGNDDGADSSLNGEDPGSARTVSNDAFGPMSPPAVSRPSLGRFGSNVEQAHAAMALEDAFANEAAEGDNLGARLDEDAESVGTLDTFATPVGGDDERVSASISASAFENGDDDSASVSDENSDEDEDEDANDVSFANGATSPAVLSSGSALSSDRRDSAGLDDDVDRATAERATAAFLQKRELLFLGRQDSEAQRLLSRAWQTAPREEYADFEDPGYVRVRVPFEDEERLFKNVPGTNATSVETSSHDARDFDETKPAFTTEASGSSPAREGFFSENDDVDSTAGGFAFDRSPMALSPVGTATPASERSETLLGDHAADVTNVRLGWGGSEFGGDSELSHPQSPRTQSETDVGAFAAARGGDDNAREVGIPIPIPIPIPTEKSHLDGAADALRAWVRGEEARVETRGDEKTNDARTTSKPRDENAPETEKKSVPVPKAEEKASSGSPRVVDDSEAAGVSPSRASETSEKKAEAFETFSLKIVHRASRTGFEQHKDFPVCPGELVAGRYRVLDVLGAAAFSTAVRAEDVFAKTEPAPFLVCLKIVKNDKDFFDQSLDEVRLLRMMNDADARDEKNIVRMLDFFYHREHLFIVTELLGLNLYEHQKLCLRRRAEARRKSAAHIRRRSASVVSDASASTDHSGVRSPSPPASPDRSPDRSSRSPDPLEPIHAQYFTVKALRVVAKQVLVALEFMHARGVIHCDVKPENIVLRLGDDNARRRSVKVIDLGSSCFTTDHLSSYVQSRSYRAPEVVLGAPYDGKVDLWSLGCVLAELFTGEVLLRNESTQTALARVIGIFGPLDPELLRLGKHAGAFVTAAGVPYERRDDDIDDAEDAEAFDEESESDVDSSRGFAAEDRRESRGVRVLLPKRTSLAARLGLPPLGVACDAAATESPNRAATRTAPPAPTALPPGFAAKSAFETETTSASGLDAKRKPRDAWTATEEKDGFIEFLLLLLQPNPRRRPTAAQALAHEWLACDDDDFEDAWVPPQTASPYGDARERDILAQL